eukprot:TRINITY_DN10848_c0_g1_i4.p1 TRINITY_DN10848_c0_g1~~TRINITY_DN10848_c0_g1_i4.p1  ORF type:complete len:401 (-),score=102.38 TRINITY_DN10848_c0_g1_i4:126-1328(-)
MAHSLKYDHSFATRGLHFDVRHGTLIKLDGNYGIQPTAVTLGREQLSMEEADVLYPDQHLSRTDQTYLKAIQDAFAIPEACLLADTVQFFRDRKINFKSEYLVEDVQSSISNVHISGDMYKAVANNPAAYIQPVGQRVHQLLSTLQQAQKQLFIITNSPYWFMDAGMTHLLGADWARYFQVIITSAGKPGFFTGSRNYRALSSDSGRLKWGEIGDWFLPGRAYAQGSMKGLMKRVDWSTAGGQVLYCGDHLHSDLVEPAREYGWKTMCIAAEIEDEVRIRNSPEQQILRDELREVEALIRSVSSPSDTVHQAVQFLQQHRRSLQLNLKIAHNKNFGSIFRTHNRPTLYMDQMHRYANLYTSNLTNLLHYPLDTKFYPRRVRLPHEKSSVLKYRGKFLSEL